MHILNSISPTPSIVSNVGNRVTAVWEVLRVSCVCQDKEAAAILCLSWGVCESGMGTLCPNTANGHQFQRKRIQLWPSYTLLQRQQRLLYYSTVPVANIAPVLLRTNPCPWCGYDIIGKFFCLFFFVFLLLHAHIHHQHYFNTVTWYIFPLFMHVHVCIIHVVNVGHLSTARAYLIRSRSTARCMALAVEPGNEASMSLPPVFWWYRLFGSLTRVGTRPVSETACSTGAITHFGWQLNILRLAPDSWIFFALLQLAIPRSSQAPVTSYKVMQLHEI